MDNFIEQAAMLFDCDSSNLKEFEREDIFNNNILNGFICNKNGSCYGSMLLTKVNDEPCNQIVYATPKLQYPFDKNGKFHWPTIDKVEIWEKLDGTNILAYTYNYNNKEFLSFKTRLGPVVSDHVYGEFYSMWKELLETYSWILKAIQNNPNYNLSFELYGSRNPILIKYDTLLDTRLLFGVHKATGKIAPISNLNTSGLIKNCFPTKTSINLLEALTDHYNSVRCDMSKSNCDLLVQEGVVYYALTSDNKWRMYKCKPEEIEKIHWSASGVIPKNAIKATIVNSFEDRQPDLEYILELLREEYDENLIIKSMPRIKKILVEVQKNVKMVKKINEVYKKALEKGLNINGSKGNTMRFLSQFFDKAEMRKVASVLLNQ